MTARKTTCHWCLGLKVVPGFPVVEQDLGNNTFKRQVDFSETVGDVVVGRMVACPECGGRDETLQGGKTGAAE